MVARKFKIIYVACIYSLHYISIAILGTFSGILPENKGKENRRENWLSQSLKDSFFNDKSVLILSFQLKATQLKKTHRVSTIYKGGCTNYIPHILRRRAKDPNGENVFSGII